MIVNLQTSQRIVNTSRSLHCPHLGPGLYVQVEGVEDGDLPPAGVAEPHAREHDAALARGRPRTRTAAAVNRRLPVYHLPDGEYVDVRCRNMCSRYMSQMLYAGQSAREIVTFLSDF